MASGETTSTVQCPACKEPVSYPVRVRHLSMATVGVSIDPTPIREHLASHEARVTMELPPTAR